MAGWVLYTWGLLSIDEIIYHMKAPLEGTNTDIIIDGINACVPIAVLFFDGVGLYDWNEEEKEKGSFEYAVGTDYFDVDDSKSGIWLIY